MQQLKRLLHLLTLYLKAEAVEEAEAVVVEEVVEEEAEGAAVAGVGVAVRKK
jgi:hypothetical protein